MNYSERNKNIIRAVLSIVMGASMVLAAELLHEKEIIFPEIAALVIGAWYMNKQPWNVSKTRFVILISAAAFVGIFIVRYVTLPMYFLIILSFTFATLVIIISKTTFMPLISACILPVYMGTESIVYPVSVFIMALLIALIEKALEKTRIRAYRTYEKNPIDKLYFKGWVFRYVAF